MMVSNNHHQQFEVRSQFLQHGQFDLLFFGVYRLKQKSDLFDNLVQICIVDLLSLLQISVVYTYYGGVSNTGL